MNITPFLENELHKALRSWMKTFQFFQVKEEYYFLLSVLILFRSALLQDMLGSFQLFLSPSNSHFTLICLFTHFAVNFACLLLALMGPIYNIRSCWSPWAPKLDNQIQVIQNKEYGCVWPTKENYRTLIIESVLDKKSQ